MEENLVDGYGRFPSFLFRQVKPILLVEVKGYAVVQTS